jgi:hypothetical protein
MVRSRLSFIVSFSFVEGKFGLAATLTGGLNFAITLGRTEKLAGRCVSSGSAGADSFEILGSSAILASIPTSNPSKKKL